MYLRALLSNTIGIALRRTAAELVCSVSGFHLLRLLIYLTKLHPAQHVQPAFTIALSEIDEAIQVSAVLSLHQDAVGRSDVVKRPIWPDAEVANKYYNSCKFPLCN